MNKQRLNAYETLCAFIYAYKAFAILKVSKNFNFNVHLFSIHN